MAVACNQDAELGYFPRLVVIAGASLGSTQEATLAVIAMTREVATLGRNVAAGLEKRLGLNVVQHELVEHEIAERAGIRESQMHRFLEGEASVLERRKIDSKCLLRHTAQEVVELALKGNVLVRGWGASYLLRSVPHVICMRVCAPMYFRQQVQMQRQGTDRATARTEIERNDAANHRIMQTLFGVSWAEMWLHALVLNTARIPVEDCVDHVVRLAQSAAFQETAESRAILMALLEEQMLSRTRFAAERRLGAQAVTPGGIFGPLVPTPAPTTDRASRRREAP